MPERKKTPLLPLASCLNFSVRIKFLYGLSVDKYPYCLSGPLSQTNSPFSTYHFSVPWIVHPDKSLPLKISLSDWAITPFVISKQNKKRTSRFINSLLQ